jgi:stage II sporulation protein D
MKINKTKLVLLNITLLAYLGCAPVYVSRPGGQGVVLVRVALSHNLPQAVITGTDTVRVSDNAHQAALAPGDCWTVCAAGGSLRAVTARGTAVDRIESPLKLWSGTGVLVNGRRIAAPLELRPETAGGILVVAELPLEDYLVGVVNAELGMVKSDEIEAAKAQAVASRSYAYAKIGSRPGAGYDLESSVSDQAYNPDKAVNPTVQKAVRETEGLVLTCGGTMIAPNYHSCCGGQTAFASEVWNAQDQDFPYIKQVTDTYCRTSPKYAWHDTIAASGIALRLLNTGLAVDDIAITAKGPSHRAVALRVTAQTCDTTLYKDKIRFGLADHPLPSTKFDLACQRDDAGYVSAVVLRGFGYGHGVGMCQWGAIGMARQGKSYNRILKYYYNDVRIEKLY